MEARAFDCPLSLLLIEDDPSAARQIGDFLGARGVAVTTHTSGEGAPDLILRTQPDIVVLDLALPMTGVLAICREIRSGYANPLLILTDHGGVQDELACLAAGADDCLPKSVRPHDLLVRIQARLWRLAARGGQPDRVELPHIVVDAGRRAVCVDRRWIDLSTAEFEVLWMLARRAGHAVARREICSRLRGFAYDGLDRTVDLRVARLRRKLGDDARHPRLIKSVRGEGYMLVREA